MVRSLETDNWRLDNKIWKHLEEKRPQVTDDTNITRLPLETEIEALKKGLLFMKKNHEEEANGLQNQIANSGLTVELDASKSQDFSMIVVDILAQLHKKFEGQFGEHTEGGGDVLCHIDETTQWDPAVPSVRAGPDLGRVAAPGLAVEALLNIKVKLEAEIFTYFNLLEEGEDLYLSDTLDNRNFLQSIQKTTTCRAVDSEVVSEVNDTKVLKR
ncbi:Keratin, type I cytoskeletal 18 [Myotis brandtii]|uniref:Keratin, type I cytoskeletal 18 n=1 Tax=Myotis brandtii TaxID=109478 RepID=S7PWQ8_MYOBR|nr:Keratin, type I cytoskeletal 18 [Myotis brandtii]